MDWRVLPPLSALRAFSAFAEAGSVVAAGDALNVTHAAISQQIRALEAHLRLELVDRSARSMTLTPDGAVLAMSLRQGFGDIARTIGDLTGAEAARPLTITTTPTFAAGWLMPRLASFRAQHPEIDISIDPSPELRAVGPDGADVALRYGNGDWPGLEARLLVQSALVVVASPALIAGRVIDAVADLAAWPWLQEYGTTEATAFLQKYGVARTGGQGMTSLPGNLMLDAARDGQGVAVIARAFVAGDLAAGRLSVLFEDDEREGYFIAIRQGVQRAAVKAFVQWAVRQARPTALA